MAAPASNIRNFSIIAHIDHGKSTLADRILEITGAVDPRDHRPQMLDSMDLERERGITNKVSRSLAACDGALLLVDASQGVEAQTVANTYLAVDAGLELIPALNKIDLPGAEPERVAGEIQELLGEEEVIQVSAKSGTGVEELLEALVQRVPPPEGDAGAPARALIFDSEFDQYRGVVAYIRVVDGELPNGAAIRAMQTGTEAEVDEIGFFAPQMTPVDVLRAGEVGYLITGIKDVSQLRVGDTLTTKAQPATEPLPGYREIKPMVFCGLFPVETNQFPDLRDALEKLALNDAALTWEPETSEALGFGFRCGFLGLLHMDIVRERLEREFGLSLITTAATVIYRVITTAGDTLMIDNPVKLPNEAEIERIEEPVIGANLHLPQEFLGAVLKICEEKRGTQKEIRYLGPKRVMLVYELPLNEIVVDFYDRLKSVSRGYGSMDYEIAGYRLADLVKLDVRINGDVVDAMSMIVHRDKAYHRGRDLVQKMRELIPRQMFEVVIQAAIGSRIISREAVKALRKNVTAKCYGGDITRKRK